MDKWEVRGDYLVARLNIHLDFLKLDQRVIFEPTEESLRHHDAFKQYRLKLSGGNLDEQDALYDRTLGQFGTITRLSAAGYRNIEVSFDTGDVWTPSYDDLLIAVRLPSTDWRPEEGLPEDYYAL